MPDYSESIKSAVKSWMDENRGEVIQAMQYSIEKEADAGVEAIAAGVMIQVGKFLTENKDHLITAIAASVAAAYQAQRHPNG